MEFPTHIVAVGGLVFNHDGDILLMNNPRKGWEYPGGIVEVGETLPHALIREIKEETGVDVDIINFVGVYSNTEKKKGYNGVKEVPTIVTLDFICQYVGGDLLCSDESLEVKWFTPEEALKTIKTKQSLRLERALNFEKGISCVGWHLNTENEIEVHEAYYFKR